MEIKTYSIKDISKVGFPAVIRSAVDDGIVLITKNRLMTAMIIPTTVSGMRKFLDVISKEMEKDTTVSDELKDIFFLYQQFLNRNLPIVSDSKPLQ
jgi:hypothetical protein